MSCIIIAQFSSPAGEEVTGGEVKVSVKYGIIPVFSKTFNLCDEAKMIGLTCPLKPMMYPDGSLSVDIPSAIPGVSQQTLCSCDVKVSAKWTENMCGHPK